MENNLNYYCIKKFGIEVVYTRKSKFAYEKHNHISTYIVGVVVEGSIKLKNSYHKIDVGKDDLFLVKPYEPHAINADEEYSLLSIVLPIEFLRNNELIKTVEIINSCLNELSNLLVLNLKTIEKINYSIKTVYKGSLNKNFSDAVAIGVTSFINCPEEEITLDQLAKITKFDKYYYLRMFNRQVGLTPHRFQMQNRIRKAQRLLENNTSITEVALLTGFYDQSHFIRKFKCVVGINPRTYRNSICYCNDIASKEREKI